jgi:hypothetical protein
MRRLIRSVKYVKGEKEAIALAKNDIFSTGMKTPLIKTNGNFTRDESIKVVAGISVGG